MTVQQPGFRVDSLVVVTSLTDGAAYTPEDLAELYRQRWHVELDIAALKITLGMDVLRCKTPAMVEKEIWVCLLAYNLIRLTLLQAALLAALSPRQLSFAAAMENIAPAYVIHLGIDAARAQLLNHTLARDGHPPRRRSPGPRRRTTRGQASSEATPLADGAACRSPEPDWSLVRRSDERLVGACAGPEAHAEQGEEQPLRHRVRGSTRA